MFCKVCNKPMKHIMRFENGKSYELFQCPHCYWESKKTTLKFPHNQDRTIKEEAEGSCKTKKERMLWQEGAKAKAKLVSYTTIMEEL